MTFGPSGGMTNVRWTWKTLQSLSFRRLVPNWVPIWRYVRVRRLPSILMHPEELRRFPMNGDTGATSSTLDVTPGTTTTYGVTVTDANGCTAEDQKTVTVYDTDIERLTIYDTGNNSEFLTLVDGATYQLVNLPADFTIQAIVSGVGGPC